MRIESAGIERLHPLNRADGTVLFELGDQAFAGAVLASNSCIELASAVQIVQRPWVSRWYAIILRRVHRCDAIMPTGRVILSVRRR